MKKKKVIGRHGDLDIFEVDSLPEDKIDTQSNILQKGEHTGHAHTLVADKATVYDLPNGLRGFRTTAPGKISHQEHVERPITVGDFLIKQELYVDPIGEQVRQVED